MVETLSGRRALVTGASRGIGRAIALALAKQGARLALLARNESDLSTAKDRCVELGAEAWSFAIDLADKRALGEIVDRAARELGGLDLVVHAAGIGYMKPVLESSLDDWENVVSTNLIAAMNVSRLALPYLVESKSDPIVVLIGSISSHITYAGGTAYCASKHGLAGFAGALFEDVRSRGVRVSMISPGWVATEMIAGLGTSIDRRAILQPEDVAEAVLFAIHFPARGCPSEIVLRNVQPPWI
jgi:3-oxoacyl-[acyl-carrier protein] reductase